MVIIGPKHVPDEEPEPISKGKSQIFTIPWIKDRTQNFSSANKIGDDGFGPSSSYHNKKKWRKKEKVGSELLEWTPDSYGATNLPFLGNFNLRQIKDATQNFSPANKIGQGGFGQVYKGFLPDRTAIAVKKLSHISGQGYSEFLNEVRTISTTRHPNLVKLLGSCTENDEYILVYEYMENGSLKSALFGDLEGRNLKHRLDLASRFKICLGIAKVLAFLHESKPKIVHRDIKLSNILLDDYLNPKISDFGIAKQYHDEDQTHISTLVMGTLGYIDPDYLKRGMLTDKADVYGFGILTLELMSGRRCIEQSSGTVLLKDADDLHKKGDLLALMDEDLKASTLVEEAAAVLHLAFLCTAESPKLRPTMSQVVSILEVRTMMKTLPFPLDYFLFSTGVDSKSATTDKSIYHFSSTSTETEMEDEGELEYVELPFEEGNHHIDCSDEDFEAGCNEWRYSLVGYFPNEKEHFNVDKGMVEKLWELKGNVSVFSMGNGYSLFQFKCAEDKIRILESSDLWHVEQRLLILRKWDWKMKFDKNDEMKSLPVWVKIYKLPLFLWSSSLLSKVGSGLGIPLYVDQKTKNRERLDYAMLCIEFDASKPLPDSLNISVKGVGYQLTLEYDWKPSRCATCCTFGHIESKCGLKGKEIEQN